MGTALFDKFPSSHDFKGQKVINMGCGTAQYPAKNVTNVDAFDECKPDVVWDMESLERWPFAEDGAYDLVIFNHVLEHVKNWWHNFEEAARVLKPGGAIIVYVPSAGDSQLGYRDHVSVINHFSFHGIKTTTAGTNAWAMQENKPAVADMELVWAHRVYFNKWWLTKTPGWVRKWCAEHLRNVICEDGFYFQKTGR
jgi:SAM-dependent methyltransferase